VCNKFVYTFINVRSSVITGPIELNPIPVNFPGHFASISVYVILQKPIFFRHCELEIMNP
jgi:hypothetical protein